jgi:hypothetical protein
MQTIAARVDVRAADVVAVARWRRVFSAAGGARGAMSATARDGRCARLNDGLVTPGQGRRGAALEPASLSLAGPAERSDARRRGGACAVGTPDRRANVTQDGQGWPRRRRHDRVDRDPFDLPAIARDAELTPPERRARSACRPSRAGISGRAAAG